MVLTEASTVDAITVKETGHVEVRRATRILRDGEEVAKTYHRHVLSPGDDLRGQDERVVTIAEVAWTPEVVTAHEERVSKENARMEARAAKSAGQESNEVKTDA